MKTTKLIFIQLACSIVFSTSILAQPRVIAHRGYWDCEGAAKNSITSLQKAAAIGVYGSEFDVNVTQDGVPIVNHDASIDGYSIEGNPYSLFKNMKIGNGERIPTLEEYIKEGMKYPDMKLILEIKSASSPQAEARATKIIMDLVKKMGARKQIEYIAFSLNIVKEIIKIDSKAKVSYLNGDLSPKELKDLGVYGLDYNLSVMYRNPKWFEQARELGIHINVWTVNNEVDMRNMIINKADYITTDEPTILQKLITEQRAK